MSTWDRMIRQAVRRADNRDWAIGQAIQNCREGIFYPEEFSGNGLERILKTAGYDEGDALEGIYPFDPDGIHVLEHDFRLSINTVITWIGKTQVKEPSTNETEEQTSE